MFFVGIIMTCPALHRKVADALLLHGIHVHPDKRTARSVAKGESKKKPAAIVCSIVTCPALLLGSQETRIRQNHQQIKLPMIYPVTEAPREKEVVILMADKPPTIILCMVACSEAMSPDLGSLFGRQTHC